MVEFEYEYIPPKEGYLPYTSNLPSSFDTKNIPSGIRGEAVRSAIRSGRCICWNLGSGPLQQGWISVKGKGTLTFLNNKLSQSFSGDGGGYYKEACLLNTKGRIIDRLRVFLEKKDQAYLLTSPGHSGSDLFERLDPLIFPLDQVSLRDCSNTTKVITIASTKLEHVKIAIQNFIIPLIDATTTTEFIFPSPSEDHYDHNGGHSCTRIEFNSKSNNKCGITILPTALVPETALVGYTLVIEEDAPPTTKLGESIWRNLISEENDGAIEIGALEFETLRIESGMPAFSKEITASDKDAKRTPAGPFELHWGNTLVNMDKGCYLGQEGVASVVRNKRGPPSLLYQIFFNYDVNVFDTESKGDKGNINNLTKLPVEESKLYVLGSNNKISVGTLTSIAEPSSTGDPTMIGLALVKRPDRILTKMREQGLKIDRNPFLDDENDNIRRTMTSAMVKPPPIDPLDGLEVIIKDTYTVGILRCIPIRRYIMGQNMFIEDTAIYDDANEPKEGEVEVNRIQNNRWTPDNPQNQQTNNKYETRIIKDENNTINDNDIATEVINTGTNNELEEAEEQAKINRAIEEASKAQAAADGAVAEAKRKAEKLALLKQKAEDAMARRKAKTDEVKRKEEKLTMLREKADAAMTRRQKAKKEVVEEQEVKRKEAKMAMPKERADEAMARREQKKAEEKELSPEEAEAKRKAEKMKMLKERADEAMAQRQQQQNIKELSPKEAEAKRKAEKMTSLKQRAEEAMARRQRQKAE